MFAFTCLSMFGKTFSVCTISPLHTNLEVVSFQRCEHASAGSNLRVHVSGIHCHKHASSTTGVVLCTLLKSMIFSTEVVWYLYFKPRMCRSKHKSSTDGAGRTVFF